MSDTNVKTKPALTLALGQRVRICRSPRTGGLPCMADSFLLRQDGIIMSIETTKVDGIAFAEHATVDYAPLGRDYERLLRVNTEYLQAVK
jgi:hypothetical protein